MQDKVQKQNKEKKTDETDFEQPCTKISRPRLNPACCREAIIWLHIVPLLSCKSNVLLPQGTISATVATLSGASRGFAVTAITRDQWGEGSERHVHEFCGFFLIVGMVGKCRESPSSFRAKWSPPNQPCKIQGPKPGDSIYVYCIFHLNPTIHVEPRSSFHHK